MRKSFILFLSWALIISSCGKKRDIQTSKTVVYLFDLTDSLKQPEIKEYLNNFSKVMDSLDQNDNLICAAITDHSATEGSLLGQFSIEPIIYQNDNKSIMKADEDAYRQIIKTKKDSILNLIHNQLENNLVGKEKSEIISSLFLASNILKKYSGQKRVLVMQSDMLEFTNDLNFYKEKFSDDRINQIIDLEIKNRGIPDLDSVEVFVCGARNVSSQYQLFDVKKFWKAYFKQCKANLSDQNYNAMLIKFDK